MKKKTLKKEVKRLNKIIDLIFDKSNPVSEEKAYQDMSTSFSTTTTALDDTGIEPPSGTRKPPLFP